MPPTTRGAPARCAVTDAPAPPASSAPLAGMIPLVLRHGAVAVADADVCSHPAVGPVLDALPPCVFDTSDDACGAHGAVVLGVRSAAGATPQFDVTVGQLRVSRMLACARNKLWWMTPEWRTSTRELPPETQFMLAEVKGCEGAAYVLLLPLIDGDFRATLRAGKREGELHLRVESGTPSVAASEWASALYVAAGSDPYALVERGVADAARLSGGARPLSQKVLPPSLDVFGWCTWDAFYSKVSARGIRDGLEGFRAGGIMPRSLIIDDGWQMTELDKEPGTSAVAAAAAGDAAPPAPAGPFARLVASALGMVLAFLNKAFKWFYDDVVEPAAPGSWPVRLFTWLAAGPLRGMMLTYFATVDNFSRRLSSVRANGKFSAIDAGPDDEGRTERFGDVVQELKKSFLLDYIYCWHGLPAYWAGIAPTAPEFLHLSPTLLFPTPTPGVLDVEPAMAWNPAVIVGLGVPGDAKGLFFAMHEYLHGCGVDGIKADCQGVIGLVGGSAGGGGGPALTRRYHAAFEESVRTNFDNNHCINCMCHSTENLYRMADTAVARVSDDFYPRDPASTTPHVAACAYNSLFMSALVHPDWDMFTSVHEAAELHAMARAVSGSAIYVSDKPGEHDFALLARVVLPDGSVLRARGAARPTRDCLFSDVLRDGTSLLKAWNTNAYTGVVGVFHLQGSSWDRVKRKFITHDAAPAQLSTQVRPCDVEGLLPSEGLQLAAAYAFTSKTLRLLRADEALTVSLSSTTGEVVAIAPVVEADGVRFAPLGLCEMYNGGGAVHACAAHPAGGLRVGRGSIDGVATTTTFDVAVRAGGRFLAYCSRAPASVKADGSSVAFTYDAATCALHVQVPLCAGLAQLAVAV